MEDGNSEIVEINVEHSQGGGIGKKIGCGCGCGCLLIIIGIIVFVVVMYNMVVGFVNDFEEKGYHRVENQVCMVADEETVDGDIVYMGSVVKINGTVNGNVAALCQQLTISGTVNGDLDLMCQQVTITETGKVTGSIRAEAVQQLINNGSVGGTITGEIQSQTDGVGQ